VARVGPRIYNLFPLLAGRFDQWRPHIKRAAALGFNWLFVNPVQAPGRSGSIYSIRDYYEFNPLLIADGEGPSPKKQFSAVVHEARDLGLSTMVDLVINHTAIDAVLTETHPHWYRRNDDGSIYNPRAVDPADTSRVTIWYDLAELNYHDATAARELLTYWLEYIRHMASLGVRGFRCDAAYKVPADFWRELIASVRHTSPDLHFFAETLGCAIEETEALKDCGFDYFFNSSKWWDFKSPWLLEQHERFRRVAPSIAFPESHDTERLANAHNDPERAAEEAKFRYLFAACFSSGVMMPVGYEFGFRRPLHVVETRPAHWEDTSHNICDYIAAVNDLKANTAALNAEGKVRRITYDETPAIALLREGEDAKSDALLLLINASSETTASVEFPRLIAGLGRSFGAFEDITPQNTPQPLGGVGTVTLEPLGMRVIRAIVADVQAAKRTNPKPASALARVAIEGISPLVDGGRYPLKRVIGDVVRIEADVFSDGHGTLAAELRYRSPLGVWTAVPMVQGDNDRWSAAFVVTQQGPYCFSIEAWHDEYAGWQSDLKKKMAAGQSIKLDIEEGVELVRAAAGRVAEAHQAEARALLSSIVDGATHLHGERLLSDEITAFMRVHDARPFRTTQGPFEITVSRPAARFSAWYEIFPRSATDDSKRHGTFRDVIRRLDDIKGLGFDVLYMPPIHPIGFKNRKGRNNSLQADVDDPGSPYAIGARSGGHTAVHPDLGTIEDFRALVREARERDIEIALDFAIQCSLDHPWITEHPDWFEWRSDGSIKFAENPPKRYEDIVNVQFYGDAFPAAWRALRDVIFYWADEGVRLFRVDNPHTKPLPFWEWLITESRRQYPDILFLSEAFTRPKMMYRLAKIGFDQSYSYFTWRNTKDELTSYLTELTQSPVREFFRPNFFANTPDINPFFLQTSGRAGFMIRATLAATLGTSWGISSGFELCEATPVPGKEEFLNSEKYEIRAWDWHRPGNIRDFITALNRVRRENPALQQFVNLQFHTAHHDKVLFYSKATALRDNVIWIAVSLDPHHPVECQLDLPRHTIGFDHHAEVHARDLIQNRDVYWGPGHPRVWFDQSNPCHLWRIKLP
jgi:starch synthase (maltosyl-transferring)